jgi:hypothetical protein
MKIIVSVFIVLILMGCVPTIPSNIQVLMINSNDVPPGWTSSGFNVFNDWGGKGYIVGYEYGEDIINPGIGHQIIVYSDVVGATNGFEEYKNFYFTNIWKEPSETDFSPTNPKDFFEYKCVNSKLNGRPQTDCLALQQHNNYLSIVDVRMGEPFVNFETLNSILKIIDRKLNN